MASVVAQVSKPAVSHVSKRAPHGSFHALARPKPCRLGSAATRQVWKPALRRLSPWVPTASFRPRLGPSFGSQDIRPSFLALAPCSFLPIPQLDLQSSGRIMPPNPGSQPVRGMVHRTKAERQARERLRPVEPAPGNAGEGRVLADGHRWLGPLGKSSSSVLSPQTNRRERPGPWLAFEIADH
jgi:hypothetical protein